MRCSARKGRKRQSYQIQNFKHAKLLDKLLRKKRFNFKEGSLVTRCYTLVFYIYFLSTKSCKLGKKSSS